MEAHIHFRRQLQPPGNAPPLNTDLLHFHTATGAATSLYVLDLIMSNDGTHNLRFAAAA